MHWFGGEISEAITTSKAKGAVFVVYVEGKDDKSLEVTNLINSAEISNILGGDNFVAIKIEADSVKHQQFCEIFQRTTVPAAYFIGKTGAPLEIVVDFDHFSDKINAVLSKAGMAAASQNPGTTSANLISSEQSAMPSNVVCDNGVCTIQPAAPLPDLATESKVERAKELIEKKREAKEKEEAEAEKEKEIERRKMGQNVQQMKRWQEDQDLKQLRDEREKERRETKAARDRVLAQIEQDKAERAARYGNPSDPEPVATPTERRPVRQSNTARLQFKLPDGATHTHEFESSALLSTVRDYIKSDVKSVSGAFSLSTTFPRRIFGDPEYLQNLVELELVPNAVILVLPLNQRSNVVQSQPSVLYSLLFSFLAPLVGVWNFLRGFVGLAGNEQAGADKRQADAGPSGSRTYSSSNSVIEVRSKYDFDNRLKSAYGKLVVVDFFATWCGPCKMIAPRVQELARRHSNVVFLKVDVDNNGDIAQSYRVASMPTFVFFKNGREVGRFSGADEGQLVDMVNRYK